MVYLVTPSPGDKVPPSPSSLMDHFEHLVQNRRCRPVLEVAEHFCLEVEEQLVEHEVYFRLRKTTKKTFHEN